MEPYPSVLTVQALSRLLLFVIRLVGPGAGPMFLLTSDEGFRLPLMSPRDIFSMLLLISPMTAVWPLLGMLGTLGPSLFLILAARGLVRKLPDSPNSPPTPIAAATAI